MTPATRAVPALPGYRVERGTTTTRLAAILGAGLVVAFATLPAWGTSGMMKLLVEFFTILAMAQMWNLLAGFAGLVSIGQQAFVGIGAYGLYVFLDRLGLPPLAAIGALAAAATVIALLTSLFAFRLRGGYFAIGTWVIAEVFRLVVAQVPALGAGTGVTIGSLVSMDPQDRLALTYWLAIGVGFGSIVLAALVVRSRLGLALRAIRDSEVSAQSLGVGVLTTKRIVYVIASVGCAIAGAVYYLQLLRIQPTAAFSVDWTVVMIFVVVIGGLGRIEGPIAGAIVFFALQEWLADYGSAYLIALGLVTIVIVVLAPRGLWGLLVDRRPVSLFAIERSLKPVARPATVVSEGS
jgi:branched-chain amino acid transport system permease protein